MTRPLEIEFAGAVYHLTLRGNAHLNFDRAVSQFPLDYINRK